MTGGSVAGRFALVEELGRGGMGVVWRATDTLLGREVAVKQILAPPHLSETVLAERRARMLREGRAAARLNHPNAVTVYDVLDEEDSIYIVMEFLQASSLWEFVQRDGPLNVGRVARIGLQLLDVLTEAHVAGIVHRDVKPANVLVLPKDRAKLADFGIASLEGDTRLTGTGTLMGSPAYMAPEQIRGQPCTPASDLWSLGVTLYYALEGRDAFEASTFPAVVARILDGAPPEPANAGPLEPLLAELLNKDPAARPEAEAVQKVLEGVGRDSTIPQPAPEISVPAAEVSAPASQPTAESARSLSEPQPVQAVVEGKGKFSEAFDVGFWVSLASLAISIFYGLTAGADFDKTLNVSLFVALASAVIGFFCEFFLAGAEGFLEVDHRGISFKRNGYSASYDWDQISKVTLAHGRQGTRKAIMVRPISGTEAGSNPLQPQLLHSTPGRSPWSLGKTGWVGLCHLDEVKADPETVEQAIIVFSGPRWQASR